MNSTSQLFEKKDNLIFASFQGIKKGIPTGMARVMLPILERLQDNGHSFIYYVSVLENYNGSIDIREVSKFYTLFTKTLSILNWYTFRLPSHKMRFIQEKLFDFFLSLKLKNKCIVVSTAHLFKTTLKNKNFGGVNILYMSNPDEALLFNLLTKEKKKYSLSFTDAYTYKRRILFTINSTNSFDHIVCISSSVYETFNKRISEQNLSCSYYYIVPNEKVFPEQNIVKYEEITFIYIGHTVWLKGIYYLLLAWEKADLKFCNLIIVGNINSTLNNFITSRFSSLHNIQYIGNVKNPNSLYRQSHVFISPSLLDAHPTTICEALYCGLPVISSNGCGAKNLLIDGVNGFVVPAGDANAIASKLKWFYDNPSIISSMGKKAKETMNKLSKSDQVDVVSEHILQTITMLLSKKNR